jgi:hypothetical protein
VNSKEGTVISTMRQIFDEMPREKLIYVYLSCKKALVGDYEEEVL